VSPTNPLTPTDRARHAPEDRPDELPTDPTGDHGPGAAPPGGRSRSDWASGALSLLGLALSAAVGFMVSGDTLWGLLPIALYAVLSLLGMDLVLATIVSLASGLLIEQSSPGEVGLLLGESTSDLVTQIGIIIMLGAGVGEVLRVTGVAENIVVGILRLTGEKSQRTVQLGIMLSCLVLVTSLGTLAGALAIAAPVLIPVAARVGFTRSATAAAMFIGGCAGLALAPFAGSNVAIMEAADVGYLTYLQFGAAPLAVVSLVVALFVVPLVQRRTVGTGDEYDAEESGSTAGELPARASVATATFVVVLLASVLYAAVTKADTTFPLLALPVIGFCVGVAARIPVIGILQHFYRGARQLLPVFFLFWLLAALFLIVDAMGPFNVVLDRFGPQLSTASGLAFVVLIGLLGWVGIPGATAAQVVLIDKVFGSIAAALGIPAGVWVIALLWGSKADTYGPFPNGNMVGAMGLAHSTNLRSLLGVGWIILVPACLVYVAIAALTL